MKIICIGRNYAAHIEELKNDMPDEPVVFLKPDTALLREGQDFYLPEHLGEIHHEIELVLKICKEGKWIQESFADKYFDEIGLGIDFTARDLQTKLKSKGLPWEKAKAFDGAAFAGKFFPKELTGYPKPILFSLKKNAETVQQGDTSMLLFNFNKIVSHISEYFTLRKGDLIYTGTPAGVASVKQGDILEGFIGEQKALHLNVK